MARHQASGLELLGAAQREQAIIAQEMHDTVCQTLAAVSLLVGAALRARQKGRPVEVADLERIKENLLEAVDQVRILQVPHVISLKPEKLVRALADLAASNKSVTCGFKSDYSVIVEDVTVAQAIYRVARETLQNVARSESEAQLVMSLSDRDSLITFEITYDQSTADAISVLSGDGMLRQYTEAAGLNWKIDRDGENRCRLIVSKGQTDHSPDARDSR